MLSISPCIVAHVFHLHPIFSPHAVICRLMIALHSYISLVLRLIVGSWFLYAAVDKIVSPYEFSVSIMHYGILPLWAVNGAALALPWIELLAGSALILGYRVRAAALLCLILLIVFTIAVAWAVVNGLTIDCGCFGAGKGEETSWIKVAKNVAWMIPIVWLILKPSSAFSVDRRDA